MPGQLKLTKHSPEISQEAGGKSEKMHMKHHKHEKKHEKKHAKHMKAKGACK